MSNFFSFNKEKKVDLQLNAKKLARQGIDDYNIGKYFVALVSFNEILTKYPFSAQASLAELKAADCNYYLEKYAEAYILYKAFEERHPTNEAIPYVMYQKGMCYYKRIDRVDRDITGVIEAIDDFNKLLKAYPLSPYTEEVKARILAAQEFKVNHEYFVVQYYLRSEKYGQAEARLKYLIAAYPHTAMIPQAQILLDKIQAGEPPKSKAISWFPDLSLPSWTLFAKEKDSQ